MSSGQAGDDVVLRLGEREASFEVDRARLTTRVIEGEFPNYGGLIPRNHPNRLSVNRDLLLDAVRRVRLLARESTPVRLVMGPEGLDLMAVTQDVGQAHESLDARYEGSELTVAFNPEYLLEGLDATPGDEVVLHTLDGRNPARAARREHRGLPLPAHAGQGVLSRRSGARAQRVNGNGCRSSGSG